MGRKARHGRCHPPARHAALDTFEPQNPRRLRGTRGHEHHLGRASAPHRRGPPAPAPAPPGPSPHDPPHEHSTDCPRHPWPPPWPPALLCASGAVAFHDQDMCGSFGPRPLLLLGANTPGSAHSRGQRPQSNRKSHASSTTVKDAEGTAGQGVRSNWLDHIRQPGLVQEHIYMGRQPLPKPVGQRSAPALPDDPHPMAPAPRSPSRH